MKYQVLSLGLIGIVLLASGCISTGGSPTVMPTQSQITIAPTVTPTPTATATITNASTPTPMPTPTTTPNVTYPQYLAGFVLDNVGNSVPYANVTLWQNGQMVNPPVNIQDSGDGLLSPLGAYSFVLQQDTLQPGEYQIMAVKDGFMGSINVNYYGTTVNKNISLLGYVYVHQATPTPTPVPNITYPLYLTGLVLDCNGYSVPYANVTLWQNGHLVNSTNNPQLSSDGRSSALGTYNFTINQNMLQMGDYRVMALKDGQSGNITVDYAGSSVYCNVSIPSYAYVSL